MDRDSRGTKRGKCRSCSRCSGFTQGAGATNTHCALCGCPPGKHLKLQDAAEYQEKAVMVSQGVADQLASLGVSTEADDSYVTKCSLCNNKVHFDINSGKEFKLCKQHFDTANGNASILVAESDSDSDDGAPLISNKCAIKECRKASYVDPNGKVHECCGFSHAMELIRRKNIERKHKQ